MVDAARAYVSQLTLQPDAPDALTLMRQAGMQPDPWQVDALQSTSRYLLLLAARQVGKSTVTAALAVRTALHQPGSLTLITAPSERQSKELLRKVVHFYRQLGRPVPADVEGKTELELMNGSRVIALPANESTTRGLSDVQLLIVDEAAYLPENIYLGMLPAVAATGRRVVLSTAWAKGSWLYRAWTEGEAWERIKVTVHDSPRYTPERIADAKRDNPAHWWKTQYLCEWIDDVAGVFGYDLIQRGIRDDIEPLWAPMHATTPDEADEGAGWINSLW